MLFTSLRHATTNLANFRGRDNPALFWPFAGLVIGAVMVLSMAGAMILMAQILPRMIAYAQAHPEQTHIERGLTSIQVTIDGPMTPSPFDPTLFRQFIDTTLAVNAIILIILVVLLGAAVTRRLHDSAMPGVIAWIPVVLMVAGMAQMRGMLPMDAAAPIDLTTFFRAFATNLAYLISLGGLVYLLIRRGTPGENRYGAPR